MLIQILGNAIEPHIRMSELIINDLYDLSLIRINLKNSVYLIEPVSVWSTTSVPFSFSRLLLTALHRLNQDVLSFYLGNSSKGVAQLLIALIGSLALGLGFVVAYVWAFVDAYNIITDKAEADANGFKIMTFAEELAKAQQKD